jgi:hypothetical protein
MQHRQFFIRAPLNAVIWGCVFLFCLTVPLSAQDADISGVVRDTSGATIPKASLKLSNQATGVSRATETNSSGLYSFPRIQAGVYDISATAQGFQSQNRVGITVNVADHSQIDFELKVGNVKESITVTQGQEMLNTVDSVTGQTIDRALINDLPLLTRSALDLAFLAPGVSQPVNFAYGQNANSVHYLTANNFVSNGSRNATSDVLLDGITTLEFVVGGNTTFSSYTPSVDAVQEFKVQQTNFNAEYGFSGATIVNVVTRSGTNQLHGSGFEFLRNQKLDANNFFNNEASMALPALRQNNFGATVGGPVIKNRTFFFGDYEGTRVRSLTTAQFGVPSAAEKTGNFGEVCTLSGGQFDSAGMCSNPNGQLWDPYTGVYDPSQGGPVRSGYIPFNNMATYMSPGSPKLAGTGYQLPSRPGNLIDPAALKLMQFFPDPNLGVGTPSYNRFNNFLGTGTASTNNDQFDIKIDHRFSDQSSLSAKYSQRNTLDHAMNCFGNMADPCTSGPVNSTAHLFGLNFTHVFNPTTVFTFTYGLTRTARFYHTIAGDYPNLDPVKDLGMPSYIESSGVKAFPQIQIGGGYAASPGLSIGTAAWSYLRDGQLTHNLLAALSKVEGQHELKAGVEGRQHRFNFLQPGTPAGLFVYDFNGTSQMPWSGGGDAMATFLTGTSTSSWGQYEIPAYLGTQNFQWAGYVQDNYRASKKLTVNVGLRYELTMPSTERHNQGNWVDPNVASPVQAPGFSNLKGGVMFTNSNTRTYLDTDYRDFEPRIGLAYQLNDKTVLRTGYGIYYDNSRANANADSVEVLGYAQKTNWVTTYQSDGATPWGRLSDPFPSGVKYPPGNSLGLMYNVGQVASGVVRTLNYTPYSQSWSFGFQRTLPGQVMIDANCVGKRGTHLYWGGAGHLNHLTSAEEGYSRDQITALNTYVNNPFYGIITDPTSSLSSPQVSAYQLQLPYPQFTDFDILTPPWANSIYHAFQLRVDKRFSNGLQFLVTYVKSKSLDDASLGSEGNSFLGGSSTAVQDPNKRYLERSLSQFDIPNVLQFSYVYPLPFGRNRHYLSKMPTVLNAIIGGWQTSGMWRFDDGQPLVLGLQGGQPLPGYGQRANLSGNPERNTGSDWLNQYFANPQVFSVPPPYTLGTAPRTLGIRAPGTRNATLSLSKEFTMNSIREGMRTEVRMESFNALNHPQFCGPNTTVGSPVFGQVTCQANSPREVQLGLKLYW